MHRKEIQYNKKAVCKISGVVILGGSSGIGLAVAELDININALD